VHLPDYGLILVFKIVITEDDIEYWATNDLAKLLYTLNPTA
jgi:hypothetical protein